MAGIELVEIKWNRTGSHWFECSEKKLKVQSKVQLKIQQSFKTTSKQNKPEKSLKGEHAWKDCRAPGYSKLASLLKATD